MKNREGFSDRKGRSFSRSALAYVFEQSEKKNKLTAVCRLERR